MPSNNSKSQDFPLESISDLSDFLSFLACASEDEELCHPGLSHSIRLASAAARNLNADLKKNTEDL